jgi:hypothetical protein
MRRYRFLSAADKVRIAQARKGDLKELADELQLNYHTLRARRSELKKEEHRMHFPEASTITACEVLTLEDPNVLILSDIHAPFHNPATLSLAVRIISKHFPHIKHCAIIGDIFDFSAISVHINNAPTTSVETDIRAGGAIVRELRKHFEVWIGPGNHCERISKKLNSQFSMESLLCGALGNRDPGLHFTDLDYMYIGADIVAGHPSMFSSKPAKLASKLALFQRRNVITGHSHKLGLTVSEDGEHWAIDNGHCASSELFYYAKRRLNTFSAMASGFSVISNGRPFIFGDAITDWDFWLV